MSNPHLRAVTPLQNKDHENFGGRIWDEASKNELRKSIPGPASKLTTSMLICSTIVDNLCEEIAEKQWV